MEGGGRGQGVPERSWEFMVFSLLILTHKKKKYRVTNSLSVMLCGLLPSLPIYIFPFCVFWVVWTIKIQFCSVPFWAICFREALSKRSHALLLSSALFSFSRDFFFPLTTLWLCSLVWTVKCQKTAPICTNRPLKTLWMESFLSMCSELLFFGFFNVDMGVHR